MKLKVEQDSRGQILRPEGEIDLHYTPELRARLLRLIGTGRGIVIDMSGVTYIDSSGVATLVEGLKRARDAGQAFLIAGVQDAPMRVLELTRLDQVFALYPDRESALQALRE